MKPVRIHNTAFLPKVKESDEVLDTSASTDSIKIVYPHTTVIKDEKPDPAEEERETNVLPLAAVFVKEEPGAVACIKVRYLVKFKLFLVLTTIISECLPRVNYYRATKFSGGRKYLSLYAS